MSLIANSAAVLVIFHIALVGCVPYYHFRSYLGSRSLVRQLLQCSSSLDIMGACLQFMTRATSEQHGAPGTAEAPSAPLEVQAEAPSPPQQVVVSGVAVPRCESPCPCCFYTLSTSVDGSYTVGWRKFGGRWSWWHGFRFGAPHGQIDPNDSSLGIHAPGTPACRCCYYASRTATGPGWYLDQRQHWRWCAQGASHAIGFDWSLQPDDARYMAGRPSQGDQGPIAEMALEDHWLDEHDQWDAQALREEHDQWLTL